MKDQELMSLLFSDATDFRDELLAKTLRSAPRRRRVRRWGQTLTIAALFATALWWSVPRKPAFVAQPSASGEPAVHLVYTQSLPPECIVTSYQGSVTIIPTDNTNFALVGDEELLDLVPGETKLLVWHAPHQAELVIVGP